jgi:two-component system nitrate/nitrite response regulator NarL
VLRDLRVLVVDDNPVFLRTSADYVARTATIVGRAASGAEGVQLAVAVRPDLVLVDLNMPDMNGIECARRIKEERLAASVVIVTAHDYALHEDEARRAGVAGFVSKWEFVAGIKPWLARQR